MRSQLCGGLGRHIPGRGNNMRKVQRHEEDLFPSGAFSDPPTTPHTVMPGISLLSRMAFAVSRALLSVTWFNTVMSAQQWASSPELSLGPRRFQLCDAFLSRLCVSEMSEGLILV